MGSQYLTLKYSFKEALSIFVRQFKVLFISGIFIFLGVLLGFSLNMIIGRQNPGINDIISFKAVLVLGIIILSISLMILALSLIISSSGINLKNANHNVRVKYGDNFELNIVRSNSEGQKIAEFYHVSESSKIRSIVEFYFDENNEPHPVAGEDELQLLLSK